MFLCYPDLTEKSSRIDPFFKRKKTMSKNLVFGEKAKNVTIKLYSWEKAIVRSFIKTIRKEKKQEILKEKNDGK